MLGLKKDFETVDFAGAKLLLANSHDDVLSYIAPGVLASVANAPRELRTAAILVVVINVCSC
jgi:hypothetical protein